MNQVLCSILIPVFNGEQYIEKTVISCLSQTLSDNIEIIIIDDSSSDRSFEIIEQLATKHDNIIALRNINNSGINKTVNHAARLAKGKFIMFLGHDDMLRERHIEIMLDEADDSTAFVHCNSDIIDDNDNIIGAGVDDKKQRWRTRFLKYYLAFGNMVHSTGAIINREFLERTGGWDETFRNYGEWLMWIKLTSLGPVKYSTRTRALYRKHETNITNTFNNETIKPELAAYFAFCTKAAYANINNIVLELLLKIIQTARTILKQIRTMYILG